MKGSSLVSRSGSLVCPLCEVAQLRTVGYHTVRCESCARFLNGDLLKTLRQITALTDCIGSHACECGHPEMQLLPDGSFHCPACRSEVLPIDAPSTPSKPDEHIVPYWAGWLDGRFGGTGSFVDNSNLAKWEEPSDRLAYYRGHRAGSEARLSKSVVRTERPQQMA